LPHRAIAERIKQRVRQEEVRVLYTALTRAQECLILSAAGKRDMPDALRREWAGHLGPLPEYVLGAARSPADWVFPAAACGGPGMPVCAVHEAGCPATAAPAGRTPAAAANGLAERLARGEAIEDAPELPPDSDGAELLRQLQRSYPYARLAIIPAHRSVTELRAEVARVDAPLFRPRFLSEGPAPPTAAEIGTAVHAVLEHVDLTGSCDERAIRAVIDRLIGEGRLPTAAASAIRVDWLVRFYEGSAGRFLREHASTTAREVPITFALKVGELPGELPAGLSDAEREETVLVRGVIDALVEFDGGFRLLDYKTDDTTGKDLAEKEAEYRPQLDLYRRAVEAIHGKPVRRATLCFLSPGVDLDLWA
jgi:ATP-dependent helicase/nuclease subunit A